MKTISLILLTLFAFGCSFQTESTTFEPVAEGVIVEALDKSGLYEIPPHAKAVYAVSTGGTANTLRDARILLISLSRNYSAEVTGTIDGIAIADGNGLPVVGNARFFRLANGTKEAISATLYAEVER
jgi:hypothetical protein